MPEIAQSVNPPVFLDAWDTVVEENMAVGEFVTSVFAIDEDSDPLWYTITGKILAYWWLLQEEVFLT